MRQTNNVQEINVHVPLLFGQKFNFFGEAELLFFTDAIKRQNPLFVGSLTDPSTHPKCVTIFVAAVQGIVVPDIRFPEEIECLPTAGFMEREDFPISFGEWIKQRRSPERAWTMARLVRDHDASPQVVKDRAQRIILLVEDGLDDEVRQTHKESDPVLSLEAMVTSFSRKTG
jgi:hypothetical protein